MGDPVLYLQSLITARKATIARKMREVKFRLRSDGQIVGYEKHTLSENSGIEIYHSTVNDDCDGWAWVNVLVLRSAWITHDTKEQFTGLLDREGREIYEGDLVKITRWAGTDDESSIVGEIFYERGSFKIKNGPAIGTEFIGQFAPEIRTIIGNIHQNPELLEAP